MSNDIFIRPFKKIYPKIGKRVYIDPKSLVIGNVVLNNDVSIWPFVSIRGDLMQINIGESSNIQDGSILHTTHSSIFNEKGYPIIIGKNVTIGHKVMLHGCTVEEETLIGMNSVILDGAIIQKNAIIGAGSLVSQNKIIKGGYLWVGNPVKKIRILTKKEISFFRYSALHYVSLKNQYLKEIKL